MTTINPYLTFDGTCDAAFEHYKSVFGGEFTMKMRMKDSPDADKLPAGAGEMIMHVGLPIGGGTVLMGSDAVEGCGPPLIVGTNFSVAVSPDNEADTRKIFDGLAAGGTVAMPLQKVFWGELFGMLVDKFGIQWMVNYDKKK